MDNAKQDKEDQERRRYFRIDDNVIMQVKRLDQRNFDDELERFDQNRESFCFMNNAELQREQHLTHLRNIQQSHPDIASYLLYLESRVETLTKLVATQDTDADEQTCRVNVSAQGIRFHTNLIYDTDDFVELRITLLPERKRLLVIGTVVWCLEDRKAPSNMNNAIAVDFTYIHEADREVLVKHIHNKQINKLGIGHPAID